MTTADGVIWRVGKLHAEHCQTANEVWSGRHRSIRRDEHGLCHQRIQPETLEFRVQHGDERASSQWALEIYLELAARAGCEAAED